MTVSDQEHSLKVSLSPSVSSNKLFSTFWAMTAMLLYRAMSICAARQGWVKAANGADPVTVLDMGEGATGWSPFDGFDAGLS